MMLCIFIYYLDSAFSDNKHELVQVVVAANVTTHKIPPVETLGVNVKDIFQ